MPRTQKTVEVHVPVHVVYDQWRHFEDFPRFMQGVKEVSSRDGKHVHWRAEIAGVEKEWDAEITRQVPDRCIAWRSTSGSPNNGEVRFEPLGPGATRVQLTMDYEPQNALERAGDALGLLSAQLSKIVDDFRDYVERRHH